MTTSQILVVEDDPNNADMLMHILKPTGAQIVCVVNGSDALAAVQALSPDLIIMDQLLPRSDLQGWDVIQKLKQSVEYAPIPIIAISGGNASIIQQALNSGADEAIRKPFDLHHMRQLVLHYLYGARH